LQVALEEGRRGRVGLDEPGALSLLGAAGRTALGVAQGHTEAGRQLLDGLAEGDHVRLHHEVDDIATGLTAETVVETLRGRHVEGGAAFVVEGTQALQGTAPRWLERDLLGDHLIDAGAVTHSCDVFREYPRHCPIVRRLSAGAARLSTTVDTPPFAAIAVAISVPATHMIRRQASSWCQRMIDRSVSEAT
jgi:hypothetical protein